MSIFALVLDQRPDFVPCNASQSCDTLPIGDQPLIVKLADMLETCGAAEVFVIPPLGEYSGYQQRICSTAAAAQILPREGVRAFFKRCEPADQLLIFNARYFPHPDIDLSAFVAGTPTMPRYLVSLANSETGTREKLVLNEKGEIASVQRLYDGRTHLQSDGIIATLLSAAVAARMRANQVTDLRRLRFTMAKRGIPAQDQTVSSKVYDLCNGHEFLRLSDDLQVQRLLMPEQSTLSHTIDVGAECEIHPTARMTGPLIISSGAKIEAGAVVIGPTIVGSGARVSAGAIVANSVLLSNSTVKCEEFVHESIVSSSHAHRVVAPESGDRVFEENPNAASRRETRSSTGYKRWKAALDYSLTAAGLILIAPLLFLAGLLVKLTSRGPSLYGDEREGRASVPFRCLKFRTMIDGAHRQQRALHKQNRVDGPQFKLDEDPRITWVGKYLRLLNIDELPQLFNVLRGEMSLVGPRPSPFRENQVCVAWRNARLSVLPGITGLWQICRNKRDESDFHQWIHYDLLYVRHASLWLDLKILLATFATLGGKWSVPAAWILPMEPRSQQRRRRASEHDYSIARVFLASLVKPSGDAVKRPGLKAAPCAV